MENSLIPFFAPNGIAVVGASVKKEKLGYGITRNIVRSGYHGELFLINPKGGELYGIKIHKSFEGISEEIDLCILVIPAELVMDGLKDGLNRFWRGNPITKIKRRWGIFGWKGIWGWVTRWSIPALPPRRGRIDGGVACGSVR